VWFCLLHKHKRAIKVDIFKLISFVGVMSIEGAVAELRRLLLLLLGCAVQVTKHCEQSFSTAKWIREYNVECLQCVINFSVPMTHFHPV